MKQAQEGFTLIEIIIVVAILGILVVVAIPNLLRARLNANEGSMRGDLRTFSSANESYRSTQRPPAYSPDIASLVTPPFGPSYLDRSWTAPPKHGFNLAYVTEVAPASTYSLLAAPAARGQTANNTYCVDQTGVIGGSSQDGGANVPTGAPTGCVGGGAIGA